MQDPLAILRMMGSRRGRESRGSAESIRFVPTCSGGSAGDTTPAGANSARQRAVRELEPVIQYFEHGITIIDPSSIPIFLEDKAAGREGFRDFLLERLKATDLGIEDLELDEKPLEKIGDPNAPRTL